MGCDRRFDVRRHKASLGLGMLQDIAELRAMQLGICRHSAKAGVPDGVKDFEVIGRILCGDCHPIAGLQPKALV